MILLIRHHETSFPDHSIRMVTAWQSEIKPVVTLIYEADIWTGYPSTY